MISKHLLHKNDLNAKGEGYINNNVLYGIGARAFEPSSL